MASNAAILSAMTTAQQMGISLDPLGMVALLDVAIASAMLDTANGGSAGPYVVTSTSGDKIISFSSIADMTMARQRYWDWHLSAQGIVVSVAEFSPFGTGTNAASM